MKTTHRIFFENSKNMEAIPSKSVHLVVTSPPYPMIEMWDEMFAAQNSDIRDALSRKQGSVAFELMHKQLDPVWDEVCGFLNLLITPQHPLTSSQQYSINQIQLIF